MRSPPGSPRERHCPDATMEDLWDFFRQLPNGDKQFSVVAGAAHALATCKSRHAFWYVAQTFLTMPETEAT